MNAILEMELINLDEIVESEDMDQAKEKFKISDLDSANWALRKLKAIQEKESEIKELMDKEIERIKNWAKYELDTLDVSINFFEGLLTEYFITQRELDPKFKISTPYGKVSARKQQPKWIYDEEKLIEWLKANEPDLLRVKFEPNKTEIKKTFMVNDIFATTEDGEVVDGIIIEEQEDSISIKVVE